MDKLITPTKELLTFIDKQELSPKAVEKIQYWNEHSKCSIEPKDWDLIFLKQAYEWSQYTHDAETGHGAVLTTLDNRVISTGYNGFVKGIKDNVLPNKRPDKYPFFPLHAEINCLLDCARQGKSSNNTKIYVTGEPCLSCYQMLAQAGIVEIIYGNKSSHMLITDDNYKTNIEIFLWLMKDRLKVRHIDFSAD